MAEDAGASGFRIASAYVQVDPDAADFEGALEAQIGDLNYVVKIPVVPDTGDFAGEVDAAVAESKTAVQVPVVPDMAGFAETAQAEAAAAGEAAGLSFSEKLALAAEAGLSPVWPGLDAGAGPAGMTAGSTWAEDFAVAAEPRLSALLAADAAGILTEAGTAGAEAGAVFARGFTEATAGMAAPLAGLAPAAEAEAAVAGEEAATGFGERFSSLLSRIPLLGGAIPGLTRDAATAGEEAGASLGSRMKSAVMGEMSLMELGLGAGIVALAADLGMKFQAAMERIHTQAGVAQSAIAGLSGGVEDLSSKVGFSPTSLAGALYHVESSFASVGISGPKALDLLKIAAEGAQVGNSNLVDTTNALDAVIASGISGITNYSQAMGALNAIVGAGDMSMQDLADAMGSGLMANAKLYGQSLQEVGAALATLGDNNVRGAKAATDLRMAWQAMLSPLKTSAGELQHLGLTMSSLGDTLVHHGFTAAVEEFVAHLKASKVPISDWGQYITDVFGKKAGPGIGILIDQLGRLQSKMPDLERGAHGFGNAWAATSATVKQKLHDVEEGFISLLTRIGTGLLPAIGAIAGAIAKALPGIEKFGEKIAHIVSPVVTIFFTGLEAIFKFLLGPMRDVTIAVGVMAAAWAALNIVMNLNPFVAIGTALILLTGLIVKYHKQIWDTIVNTWHAITSFFATITDPIVKPVEKAFDDIKKFITTSFDAWWKSHGKEVVKVWTETWDAIKAAFSAVWDFITTTVKAEWAVVMDVLKPGLDLLVGIFKVAWALIEQVFKTTWDVIAAVVKTVIAAIVLLVKTEWDILVGIFSVFLDLITGHWSKAWTDLKTMTEQVWNAIKEFFGSVWHDIYNLAVQVVNNLKSFLVQAWDDIKSAAVSAFDDVRHEVAAIWDGILHDIEAIVDKIKSIIGDITGAPGKLISSALGAVGIHFAGGGVLPGYAPGHDTVNARLSPGEGVLVPEAVRAIGADRINAINAHYSAGRGGGSRGYADGGTVPGFYGGGVYGGPAQMYGIAGGTERAMGGGAGGGGITLIFNGTQWPTPEQQQAMMMQLSALVGVS